MSSYAADSRVQGALLNRSSLCRCERLWTEAQALQRGFGSPRWTKPTVRFYLIPVVALHNCVTRI